MVWVQSQIVGTQPHYSSRKYEVSVFRVKHHRLHQHHHAVNHSSKQHILMHSIYLYPTATKQLYACCTCRLMLPVYKVTVNGKGSIRRWMVPKSRIQICQLPASIIRQQYDIVICNTREFLELWRKH